MKRKTKVVCPICSLVVALNSNGVLPRHKPRWRGGPLRVSDLACFGSGRTMLEAEAAMQNLEQWDSVAS